MIVKYIFIRFYISNLDCFSIDKFDQRNLNFDMAKLLVSPKVVKLLLNNFDQSLDCSMLFQINNLLLLHSQ